ncbi:hypothetical protein ACFOEE_11610 [Pseudoalteromonas fenneropenaei]|uniref:Uncharacterized protein n=1 Tax=Pseudoalteromonas fenneropenaei TaxID=1737459 RepID=A0ABV7CKL1_9GAMM
MFKFFQSQPLISEEEQDWLIDVFVWAAEYLDGDYFLAHTQLVTPTAQHFPDRVSSIEDMATSVFRHVVNYAGMSHWPLQLVAPNRFSAQAFPALQFAGGLRGKNSQLMTMQPQPVYISFNPQQINQPEDLVASFAVALAHVLVAQVRRQGGPLTPGGEEQLAAACDAIAIYLGFGIMLSNTAYRFKGGCGSCYNPYANRQAALSEAQSIFMHALVSHFKPDQKHHSHLKGHVRSQLKQAQKQLVKHLKTTPQPVLLAMESSHGRLS